MARCEGSKSTEEVAEGEIAEASATIHHLIDSNALDIFADVLYKPLDSSKPSGSSPVYSARIEAATAEKNREASHGKGKEVVTDVEVIPNRYPHLSTLNTSQLEAFSNMPNAAELERLLEASVMFGSHLLDLNQSEETNEANTSNATEGQADRRGWASVAEIEVTLANLARFVAEVSPQLTEVAQEFAKLSPELLTSALTFHKFTESLLPFLDERFKDKRQLVAFLEENTKLVTSQKELEAISDEMVQELKTSKNTTQFHRKTMEWQGDRIKELNEEVEKLKDVIKEAKFPKSKQEDGAKHFSGDEKSKIQEVTAVVAIENRASSFQDASTQTECHEVDELKEKVEKLTKENASLQSDLERLEHVVRLDDYLPKSSKDDRWLAWIQKLEDKPTVVSRAMKGLLKLAGKSDEQRQIVESSMLSLRKRFETHPKGTTEITCWGDMDAMFERLNHTKKEESLHINWALEVEEGWVPYNTLSAHIKDNEKTVVHASHTFLGILEGKCSICQGPFGPEGALTMGQCRHTFHVMCIIKASLVRSVCPECRSPLSSRFYEMVGTLECMPPSHEYNRWNLPLDQAPFYFQNYMHWGKPLTWDSLEEKHGLYDDSMVPLDPLVWMTKDREVELRARGIDDDEARELFCRGMGGHWSGDHHKFF